jgi:hypothetical protein
MTSIHSTQPLATMTAVTSDFDFLQGAFDVISRRLTDPFDENSGWAESAARSIASTRFAGAVSLDETWFPDDAMYGMSLRLFDPNERRWTVYWVNSRTGTVQSPVTGVWQDGRCWLTGPDDYAGRPILASYSWSHVSDAGGQWEQCFSTDGAATWQPNWRMQFTRRPGPPDPAGGPRITSDFDFLHGAWRVEHRRLVDPVGGGTEWVEFDGGLEGSIYFNGAVSVDEMSLADAGHRGMTFRTYDPRREEWSIYWVNSRVGRLEPPVRGRFVDGIGTFLGEEQLGGRRLLVRFTWSDIAATTARWRQAFSFDGGVTWDDNWEMRFTREPAA